MCFRPYKENLFFGKTYKLLLANRIFFQKVHFSKNYIFWKFPKILPKIHFSKNIFWKNIYKSDNDLYIFPKIKEATRVRARARKNIVRNNKNGVFSSLERFNYKNINLFAGNLLAICMKTL